MFVFSSQLNHKTQHVEVKGRTGETNADVVVVAVVVSHPKQTVYELPLNACVSICCSADKYFPSSGKKKKKRTSFLPLNASYN